MTNHRIFELLDDSNLLIGVFDSEKNLVEFNKPFAYYAETIGRFELKTGFNILNRLEYGLKRKCNSLINRCLQGEKIVEVIQHPFRSLVLHLKVHLNPINIKDDTSGIFMLLEDVTDLYEMQKQLSVYSRELENLVSERSRQLVITNRKLIASNLKLEETLMNLELTQEQLISNAKMAQLGTLSAGLCHEINNPLNFLSGAVDLLERDNSEQKNNATNKKYFKIAKIGIAQISKIVSGLSKFSNESYGLSEICDVRNILENCTAILKNHRDNDVKIVLKCKAKSSLVCGNQSDLHYAIFNLLINARQSIVKKGSVEARLKKSENRLLITIVDNGIGMTIEEQTRAFDPFFTTKSPGDGVGLGLSISNKIIKEHKGQLSIRSNVKKGTEVTIILPLLGRP